MEGYSMTDVAWLAAALFGTISLAVVVDRVVYRLWTKRHEESRQQQS